MHRRIPGLLLLVLTLWTAACGRPAPADDPQGTIVALQATVAAQTGAAPAEPATPSGATPVATVVSLPTAAPAAATPAAAVAAPDWSAPELGPDAPTFYVATNGDDATGDGSAAAPWATITHALDSVADGSLILVQPGLYEGRVRIRGRFAAGVTVRSALPYQARLRAMETVLTIFEAQGIAIEGFDVAHSGPGAEPIVVQIQDLLGGAPGGEEVTSRITLRNNILHDAYDNDILKINNGARQIAVLGNLFYNQGDSDEHIDVNSVADVLIAGNVFFNAFEAANRPITGESSNYIVVKDSNGDEDGIVGAQRVTIRGNVLFNWQGSAGSNFILLGEDGNDYYEATQITIENNLILGNSPLRVRAPFGFKGVRDVLVRHNTVLGDLPSGAFALRANVEGDNQPNDAIRLEGNLFADPTGTLELFATAPAGESAVLQLVGNLYWNGGQPLPESADDMLNISDDTAAVIGDPRLPNPVAVTPPVWDGAQFADGSTTIGQVLARLVQTYAVPGSGSAARDAAGGSTLNEDISGQPRPTGGADLGAYEVQGDEQPLLPPAEPGTAVIAPAPPPPSGGAEGGAVGESLPVGAEDRTVLSGNAPAWLAYSMATGERPTLYLLEIGPQSAAPRNLSAELGAIDWVTLSGDGEWLLTNSETLDPECAGWPCLAVFPRAGGNGQLVRTTAGLARSDGSAAIARGGNLIAYRDGGGAHERDIWVTRRSGAGWSAPVAVSAASSFAFHSAPAWSADGARLLFLCGDDPYFGSAICAANADGSDLRIVLTAERQGVAGNLFYPVYAPNGEIVFEADWSGEQLWRLPANGGEPVPIAPRFVNDNAPCVLGDGRILSLWLQREGNADGLHEVKIMTADGSRHAMLLTGVDVFDIGMGCGP